MPKISVCIPTYNRKHFLKETLDSVFAQTYKDFEVVIVDDGSTDGTKQMLEENGYNVRYFWQQNAGDAAARNKLIGLAQGNYITFLDSDDLLYPYSLEEMMRAMPQDSEDVIVYGPYIAIDARGKILWRKKKKLYNGKITKQLFKNILTHSCGSLFPKKILAEAGGFNTELKICSDYDLWLKLSLKYNYIALQKNIFKRRRHSGNISTASFYNRNTEYKVLENFYYNGGGKEVIPFRTAMKRLSKEQFRAAKAAVRESMRETGCEVLKSSLKKHFQLKGLFWLLAVEAKLHPALWTKKQEQPQKQLVIKKVKSVSDLKVVIDFDPVFVNKYSGFYTFGTGLLEGFSVLEEAPRVILFYSKRFASQLQEIIQNKQSERMEQKKMPVKMRWLESFWNRFNYPMLENVIGEFDIYHCFHHLMPPTNNKPRLMTIHDLRRYKLPQLYPTSKLAIFEAAIKKADHFLAVSQSTKNDLCSIFNIHPQKVDIISLASEIEPFHFSDEQKNNVKASLSEKLGQEVDDYFVVISSPDKRKNIQCTIEAFEAAKKSLPEKTKLIVIGQLPKREMDFIEKLKNGYYPNTSWAGAVDDLRPWLGCARALIFASLYEGFGIPILEGFACGCPVITANVSSMPEVGGDGALYVDPLSTESIAQSIINISNDENLRQNLIAAGRERCKLFTWKKTAQDVVNVYKKLAGIQ